MEVSGKRAENQRKTAIAGEVSGRQTERAEKTASDEQPPVCRVCERTGEIKDANTFCVECNEHMCGNCARVHRGSRMSSRHQLLDEAQMPMKAFKARHMCDTHPDTLIEYYCKKQDQLLCRHCLALNHQGCQGDDLIANVCDCIEDSSDFKKMYKDLKDMEQTLKQHESQQNDNVAAIDSNQHTVRRDIDNFKKELYMFVDRLVDDMHKEVEGLVDTDKGMMAVVSEECDNVVTEVKDLITEIDIKKQSKVQIQSFIVMKTVQQAIEMLRCKLKSIDAQSRVRTYSFNSDKQLRDVMGSVQKLGQLFVEGKVDVQSTPAGHDTMGSVQMLGQLSVEEENVQSASAGPGETGLVQQPRQLSVEEESDVQPATYSRVLMHNNKSEPVNTSVVSKTGEIAVKHGSCKYTCSITGIVLIDDDNLAVADCNNDCVDVLSLGKKRVIHQLQLPRFPWDITKIRQGTLAFTCPDGEYIQLVSVSRAGSLSLLRQIQVQGACRGIEYSDTEGGRLVVSFINPGKVQVIDMSGIVLKDLSSDSAGKPLFDCPQYVAISMDRQYLYVSDRTNATVTGMTTDGRVKFIYHDDQLRSAAGIAVMDDGVICVCGGWSHNIHVVSSDGKKIKVLLAGKDGLRKPHSIMYNNTGHILYVGMWTNNGLQVFAFTK